jgi:DnaJ homolog subfamily A member 2
VFEQFGGMPGGGGPRGRGGGGGGGGAGEEGKKKKEEEGKLYKDLGLEKNANANDIKKAFRALAMKAHPDRGGDPDKFKEIQKAYEILSDPQKKELYDQYGMEGVEQGGDPNARGGGGDLFDILTGGMGGRRRDPNAKRRGEDVTFPLNVTLEDLYNGMSKKLRLTKNIICKDCEGYLCPFSPLLPAVRARLQSDVLTGFRVCCR